MSGAEGGTVIIGGSVAGLTTALALARRGLPVTVVDRAPVGTATDPGAAFTESGGVPQRRHSHAFLARLREALRAGAPDVLEGLLAAGATEIAFADHLPPGMPADPRPGDDQLVALACRRTTFDGVLGAVARAEPGIRWRPGSGVRGLASRPGPVPTVTGVVLDSGEVLPAGLVVDAGGRRSPLPRWLAAEGAVVPAEETSECGLLYTSRFYRLRPGQRPPVEGLLGGDLDYMKVGLFLGDNETISITMGLPTDDGELRALLRPEAFDRAARAVTSTAPWVDPAVAEPISGVEVMARLTNTRRWLVAGGRPVALGVVALGDAAVHTNPLYGRGCSLAVVQAFALAELLAGDPSPETLALAWEEVLVREVEPWYRSAVVQDRQNRAGLAAFRGEDPSEEDVALRQMAELLREGLLPATRTAPAVHRAFLRVMNLLDQPEALASDPEVAGAVLASFASRADRPPAEPLGPGRDELLELVTAG